MQKIIATIGPISSNKSALIKLKKAGMDIVRLNGSHSSLEWHKKVINLVQKVLPETPIIFDIPGRKVRLGNLNKEIKFKKNDLITFTIDKKNKTNNKLFISLGKQIINLKKGLKFFVDDGSLKFEIKKITKHDIICKALTGGVLKSRKGLNFPNLKFEKKFLTNTDIKFIKFAIKNKVDFIAQSFVESSNNIKEVRSIIGKYNFPKIVSKVENQRGLNNIQEIANSTDMIMIDRGDLAVETSLSDVVISQKKIISVANQYKKPVIVGTEMLNNMIINDFPTKAEISDITNACIDNCSATMLSGETAASKNYINNVLTMKNIIRSTNIYLKEEEKIKGDNNKVETAIQKACTDLCSNLNIDKVIAITKTGYSARVLSLCNLKQPIIAVCPNLTTAKSLNILNNVKSVYVNLVFEKKSTNHIKKSIISLLNKKIIKKNELILITYVGFPNKNFMNVLQTHHVKDFLQS